MPEVHLKTRRCEYEFTITQKYNLLIGDSGTGKTELVNIVETYDLDNSAVQCSGYRLLKTDRRLSIDDLYTLKDYIIFLDESSPLLHRKDASTILENSKNYFIIISRDVTLGFKSVSLDCVYKMKTSGQYHTFDKAYVIPHNVFKVNNIVCEDSRSGMQFLKNVFRDCDINVTYAKASENDKTGGKSKIKDYIKTFETGSKMCIVFDKSAIGFEYPGIINSIKINKLEACFIDWDSFESYILNSSIFNIEVPEPEDDYESKEVLATKILSDLIPYNKSTLSKCLIANMCNECKNDTCHFKHFNHNQLVYWKVHNLLKFQEEMKPNNLQTIRAF